MRFFEKTWRKGIFFGMKKKLKEIFLFAAVAALFLCGCGQTDQELKTKEAREKAERSSSDATKEQLLAVERCIGFSVNRGKTSCCYDAALREQAIERLQGLGYTVEDRSNQRDGMSYLISW